jgi:hypothetical protein
MSNGDNDDEFQWDYSYFKWQDIPRQVRRQMVRDASEFGRTWMHGRTSVVADIFKCDARKMYNKNRDGCRDLWKENYRRSKLIRYYTDHPITPPDPERLRVRTPVSRAQASRGGTGSIMPSRNATRPPTKTRLVNASLAGGFDFLGYHFERGMKWPRRKSMDKLKETIRQKTRRTEGRSMRTICSGSEPDLARMVWVLQAR